MFLSCDVACLLLLARRRRASRSNRKRRTTRTASRTTRTCRQTSRWVIVVVVFCWCGGAPGDDMTYHTSVGLAKLLLLPLPPYFDAVASCIVAHSRVRAAIIGLNDTPEYMQQALAVFFHKILSRSRKKYYLRHVLPRASRGFLRFHRVRVRFMGQDKS